MYPPFYDTKLEITEMESEVFCIHFLFVIKTKD